jgi:hypothetical protein
MPATIGVNSHLQWFFKILPMQRAAKVRKIYHVPFNGPVCSLSQIAADARRQIQLALQANAKRSEVRNGPVPCCGNLDNVHCRFISEPLIGG